MLCMSLLRISSWIVFLGKHASFLEMPLVSLFKISSQGHSLADSDQLQPFPNAVTCARAEKSLAALGWCFLMFVSLSVNRLLGKRFPPERGLGTLWVMQSVSSGQVLDSSGCLETARVPKASLIGEFFLALQGQDGCIYWKVVLVSVPALFTQRGSLF